MKVVAFAAVLVVVAACSENASRKPTAAKPTSPTLDDEAQPAGPATPPPSSDERVLAKTTAPVPEQVHGPRLPDKQEKPAPQANHNKAKRASDDTFASLIGRDSAGIGDYMIEGGLTGNVEGEKSGGFGFGRSGFGPGEGGKGWDAVGLGKHGRLPTTGTGQGYGVGSGRGGMRGRSSCTSQLRIGEPNARGDLDASVIRRHIERDQAQLRYCYEKQLVAKPLLAGTVVARFTISTAGAVTSATASGVDTEVSSCFAGVIERIEFPKPKSAVTVSHSIALQPCGK